MQDRNSGPKVDRKPTRALARAGQRCLFAVGMMGLVSGLGAVGAGCLSRPVKEGEPSTKTNFTAVVKAQGIDKVDILFGIDNSASMGDKQELLRLAVPDLVNRLINPFCVNEADGRILSPSKNGDCTGIGGKAEFPPIHDMHIGIVSSALGGRTGDQCAPEATNPSDPEPTNKLNAHNDDRGHLINRSGDREVPVVAAGQSNFLAWLPQVEKNNGKADPPGGVVRLTDPNAFKKDFQDLVSGVHEYGCGFEAQLESVYHFLIQPDPYDRIVRPANKAALEGIDATILKQRHDFLRPDSLVAVIMITDENDSTVDPLSVSGQGWAYLNSSFPGSSTGSAARGTSTCDTNLKDEKCTSCGFKKKRLQDGSEVENTDVTRDPNCQTNGGYLNADDDDLNVRPIRMKQRFGVDPQFPLARYINGFQSEKVPNREGEHPGGGGEYLGEAKCTNPLYAAALPAAGDATTAINEQLCNLPRGPRRPDSVFFAVIGGVPWQLLAKDPSAGVDAVELKDDLEEADWDKITGKDPANYNFDGQDIHMVESFLPRQSLPGADQSDTADPYHGREWDTGKKDLQFACTFPLPKTDAQPNGTKDCTQAKFKNACDCVGGKNPPLCDATTKTTQVRGKAYPTLREFAVVRALGKQGVISSICPIKVVDNAEGTDPLFGYRPAVKSIVDRLKNALSVQCLPQALTADASGEVPCLILETLGEDGDQSSCDNAARGRTIPDAKVLERVRAQQKADARGDAGTDLTKRPVCQLKQLVVPTGGSCKESTEAGWCYVSNTDAAKPAGAACNQAVLFTGTASEAKGSNFSLQCIRSNEVAESTGDAGVAKP